MIKFKRENIIPLLYDIITTADKETITKAGILKPDSQMLKPVQKVLAIGKHVNAVAVGDMVEINPESFPKKKTKDAPHGIGPDIYEPIIPLFIDDNKDEFLKVTDRNLLWIIKE